MQHDAGKWFQQAYIFYRRFCHLAVERIPAHNSYKDKRYACPPTPLYSTCILCRIWMIITHVSMYTIPCRRRDDYRESCLSCPQSHVSLHLLIRTSRYARDKSWLAGERRRALSAIEALVEKVGFHQMYMHVLLSR